VKAEQCNSRNNRNTYVPVAIELVIDIATDVYKSGHAGQVLRLDDAENGLSYAERSEKSTHVVRYIGMEKTQ